MLLPAPIIPHIFRADSADLSADLERLSDGLREWVRRAAERLLTIPKLSRAAVTVSGSVGVGFDETVRVGPALTTDVVNVTLQRNGPQHTCRMLHILRTTTVGRVVLWPTDCTINGAASLILLCTPGLTTVMSDGQNFFASNAGSGAM